MRYKKKPVEIEAFQMTPEVVTAHIMDHIPLPFGVRIGCHETYPPERKVRSWTLYIETLEGRMRVEPDDWIIRGIKGELYPCKPDIFTETYERSH